MSATPIPVLHTGAGFPDGWLHSDWMPDPTVVLSAFALAAGYILWTGPLGRRWHDAGSRSATGKQRAMFLAGCLAYLVALSPPLDDWADYYLVSAHMAQHMLLLFVAAPLWLAGTPAWMLEPLARNRYANAIGYAVTRPVPALIIANAILIVWHLPGAYDAALTNELVHVGQHLTMILAGLLAWWPVLGPLPAWPRLSQPLQCLYLFVFGIPMGIVGAFITLAEPGLYHFYDDSPRIFGIDLETDQQLAGLMMWVGSSMIYLLWITVIFFSWAGKEEAADLEARPERRAFAGPQG